MFKNIPHKELWVGFLNGSDDKSDYDEIIATYTDLKERWKAGERIYVGFTTGERKGSIAYIKEVSTNEDNMIPTIHSNTRYSARAWGPAWRHGHVGWTVRLAWEGRRNQINGSLAYDRLVWFHDYEGPTVWKKFDKKAAEKAATEAAVIKDRDGEVLKEGDRVLYINARYGSAAQLDRGTIKSMRVKVQKRGEREYQQLELVIDNDEGEQSKLTSSSGAVLKI